MAFINIGLDDVIKMKTLTLNLSSNTSSIGSNRRNRSSRHDSFKSLGIVINNLPADIDATELDVFFGAFAQIETLRITRPMGAAETMALAEVTFSDHECLDMSEAVDCFDGVFIRNHAIKVEAVEIEFSDYGGMTYEYEQRHLSDTFGNPTLCDELPDMLNVGFVKDQRVAKKGYTCPSSRRYNRRGPNQHITREALDRELDDYMKRL
jgi:hypothetical protein